MGARSSLGGGNAALLNTVIVNLGELPSTACLCMVFMCATVLVVLKFIQLMGCNTSPPPCGHPIHTYCACSCALLMRTLESKYGGA